METRYDETTGTMKFRSSTTDPWQDIRLKSDLTPWEAFRGGAGVLSGDIQENLARISGGRIGRYRTPMEKAAGKLLLQEHPWPGYAGMIAPQLVPTGQGAKQVLGFGAAHGLLAGDPDNPLAVNAGIGALANFGGDMAGRIMQRLAGVRGRPVDKMGRQLEDTGGITTLGGMHADQNGHIIDAALESTPGSASFMRSIGELNDRNTTRLVLKSIGLEEDAFDAVDDAALNTAEDVIGKKFRDYGASIEGDVMLDGTALSRLKSATNITGSQWTERLKDAGIDSIDEAEFLSLDGPMAMKLRSHVMKKMAGKSEDADLLQPVLDQIDRQIGSPEYDAMRREWDVLLALQKGKSLTPDGVINERSLMNAIKARRKWPEGSPQQELRLNLQARASDELSPQFGNSGTRQRQTDAIDTLMAPIMSPTARAVQGGGRLYTQPHHFRHGVMSTGSRLTGLDAVRDLEDDEEN